MTRRALFAALAAVPAIVPKLTVGVDMAAGESVTAVTFHHARYAVGWYIKDGSDGWIRDWFIGGPSKEMQEAIAAQWKDIIERAFFHPFAEPYHEEAFMTNSTTAFDPAQVCTLETLTEARRQLRMAEADAELDVLLSDDWPIYSAVKRGARPYRVDGRDYLVEVPKAWA